MCVDVREGKKEKESDGMVKKEIKLLNSTEYSKAPTDSMILDVI